MREIADILRFRADISPFLIHLTRSFEEALPRYESDRLDNEAIPATEILQTIIEEQQLTPGDNLISDARFGLNTWKLTPADRRRYFSAVSFTETPLAEVHSLLEIAHRQVNLEPYGLVFLKDRLQSKGVMPVWYLNNSIGDKNGVVRALTSLINTHPEDAEHFLPLISVFGQQLRAPGAAPRGARRVDFFWEREWRWPAARGSFRFTADDIFIGLCPHEEISHFEQLYPTVRFIDPRRTMKWYAAQLLESQRRVNLTFSVV